MPVNKWKPKKHKKKIKINQFYLMLFVSIGAPVGLYMVNTSPTDYVFLRFLQLIVAIVAMFMLAADYGFWWWFIACINAALWPIMLYGVPVALHTDVADTVRNVWLIEFAIRELVRPVMLSGVLGLPMQWIARQIRGNN